MHGETDTQGFCVCGVTGCYEWVAERRLFVKISGDDAIPDMYIGRLPAQSEADAQSMVAKIITYEQTIHLKDWRQNVLLIADDQNEDFEAVFEIMNEDAIALLPSKMVPLRAYLES